MKKNREEEQIVELRDQLNEIMEMLCIDQMLMYVCKCLVVGDVAWMDEEAKIQNLLPYVYDLSLTHFKKLKHIWKTLDGILYDLKI